MMRHPFANHIVAIAIAVVLGMSAAGRVSAQSRPAPAAANLGLADTLRATTRIVTPAVVQIFTTAYLPADTVVERPSDLVSTERGSGSGVIVDAEGYIVTNAHVVQGAQRLTVEVPVMPAGKSILASHSRLVSARIVGIDMETDIAVLKIEERGLPSLAFGDSDELAAGDLVLAFGSPMGLNNSVSLGIVSAVARQLEPESPMVYVQTDASVNPGSSGGPLVDVDGRIIGINTMINTRGGGNEGLAFAAPSNIVRTAYEQIRQYGHVTRGDVGVRAQTLTPTLAAGLGLSQRSGVILADVLPGGPAAKAGIHPGDVVVSLNGKPMENGRQLQVNLYRRAVGEVIAIEVFREGKVITYPVRIAERQDSFAELPASDPRENLVAKLGILGLTLNSQIAQMIPVRRVTSGVVVASSAQGAIDARTGRLSAGDVIFGVNGKPVENLAELRTALEPMKPGAPVVLHLERRGVLMYLPFTAE